MAFTQIAVLIAAAIAAIGATTTRGPAARKPALCRCTRVTATPSNTKRSRQVFSNSTSRLRSLCWPVLRLYRRLRHRRLPPRQMRSRLPDSTHSPAINKTVARRSTRTLPCHSLCLHRSPTRLLDVRRATSERRAMLQPRVQTCRFWRCRLAMHPASCHQPHHQSLRRRLGTQRRAL